MLTANGFSVSSLTRSTAPAKASRESYIAEAMMPNPPALEMAATKSASLIHIMVPPMMGYWVPNILVICVSIMSASFYFSL